jgi:hypothetical protein
MPEGTVPDSTDIGTLRPNAKPLLKQGTQFEPMNLPIFDEQITLPADTYPDSPIDIFCLYYSSEIIRHITQCTNSYFRQPKDPTLPRARAKDWWPTTEAEIYIYLAIRIYMTLHVDNELSDYWDTRVASPNHYISKYMTRDRFLELHMRFRVENPTEKGPYQKVLFYNKSPLEDSANLCI